jgi:hypothetical protein
MKEKDCRLLYLFRIFTLKGSNKNREEMKLNAKIIALFMGLFLFSCSPDTIDQNIWKQQQLQIHPYQKNPIMAKPVLNSLEFQ